MKKPQLEWSEFTIGKWEEPVESGFSFPREKFSLLDSSSWSESQTLHSTLTRGLELTRLPLASDQIQLLGTVDICLAQLETIESTDNLVLLGRACLHLGEYAKFYKVFEYCKKTEKAPFSWLVLIDVLHGFSEPQNLSIHEIEKNKIDETLTHLWLLKHQGATDSIIRYFYDLSLLHQRKSFLALTILLTKDSPLGVLNPRPILELYLPLVQTETTEERSTFENIYQLHTNPWKMYSYWKKIYSPFQIKTYFIQLKDYHGRGVLDNRSFALRLETGRLHSSLHRLNPMEIWEMLEKEGELFEIALWNEYEKNISSYIANRSMFLVFLHKKEYETAMDYLARSGKLQYTPDIWYLRSIALEGLGKQEEATEIRAFIKDQFQELQAFWRL